ncbi:snRNA-activating protein complex subunit 1-like [Tubulanus polymorphus]|uniref:snRNA-activating protein complex subunit 1-like n=1 Tax=Tubulanus polymorphus TaxID=672921 RepID=UPI003DA4B824
MASANEEMNTESTKMAEEIGAGAGELTIASSHTTGGCIRLDLQKLCRRFVSSDSIRYEQFAEIWRDMKMPQIFWGRRMKESLIEFIEETFVVAKEFLSFKSFQANLCGLYLLYGLYHTQPHVPKLKILMEPEQWKCYLKFLDLVTKKGHLDIEFIMRKMILSKCFYFSATERPVRNFWVEKDARMQKSNDGGSSIVKSEINDLVHCDLAIQLNAVHEQYYKMKCMLAGPTATRPSPALDVLQHRNVTETMEATIAEFEKRVAEKIAAGPSGSLSPPGKKRTRTGQESSPRRGGRKGSNSSDEDYNPDEDDDEDGDGDHGNKRATIKERAFRNKGKKRRDRRHRVARGKQH